MATAEVHNCTLCTEENIENKAISWCTECETFLCNDCDRYHAKIKLTKGHKTVTVEEYKQLPEYIVKIKNRCEDHDEKYELFCPSHDCACCAHCVTDKHQKCQNMKKLEDKLTEVKSSDFINHVEDDLKGLKGSFEKIRTYLKGRIDSLKSNNKNCIDEIKCFRRSLNDHLDMLETQMIDIIDREHFNLKSNTESVMSEVENKIKLIEQLEVDCSQIKKFATDLQVFLGVKNMEILAAHEAEFIDNLESGNSLNQDIVKVKISDDLSSILKNTKSFGDVPVFFAPVTVRFDQNRTVHAQQTVTVPMILNAVKPVLKTTVELPAGKREPEISGCQIMPNGKLLLTDRRNNCLVSIDSEGKYIGPILSFPSGPTDICYIKDNIVAVTLCNVNEVVLVDIVNYKQIKTIKVECSCFGVASDGDKLLVKLSGKGVILCIDSDGNITSRIVIPEHAGMHVLRIAIFKENIYGTDSIENKISCFSENGEILWVNEQTSISEPRGIAVGESGIIYVANDAANEILALSANGKDMKVLLSHENGLMEPVALSVDEQKHLLVVCNYYGKSVFMFQI